MSLLKVWNLKDQFNTIYSKHAPTVTPLLSVEFTDSMKFKAMPKISHKLILVYRAVVHDLFWRKSVAMNRSNDFLLILDGIWIRIFYLFWTDGSKRHSPEVECCPVYLNISALQGSNTEQTLVQKDYTEKHLLCSGIGMEGNKKINFVH